VGDALDEHLAYCSDRPRLEAFEQALASAVAPGDTVADIGCGFGILGLMCLKAGASHVWGIDQTPALEIARETMRRCGLAGRYTSIRENSFRAELPERVDLVICDHVGYFGFDYAIVETTGDARRRLLKPDGKILPQRLELEVAAVQSPACRELAEAWGRDPVPVELRWLREYGVNSKFPRVFGVDELASRGAALGSIDLREDSPATLSWTAAIAIDRDGALDGLPGWFRCEIVDGVWMTNSPFEAERLNRPQAFLPFAAPLAVTAGDRVEVTISALHDEGLIAWSARVPRTGQSVRQSTWASKILDPHDRAPAADAVPSLSHAGAARRAVLELVDGRRSNAEIERAILRDHGDLYPTAEQVVRFVRAELNRSKR
jgi:protein arginine N-methyltransferase 1